MSIAMPSRVTPAPTEPTARIRFVSQANDVETDSSRKNRVPRRSRGTRDGLPHFWESFHLDDGQLLEAGLPLAVPMDGLHDIPDPSADVHDAVVTRIETAFLHSCLRAMPSQQSEALRLRWGIACDGPHTQEEVAKRVGTSRTSVRRLLDKGMSELRRQFVLEELDAA